MDIIGIVIGIIVGLIVGYWAASLLGRARVAETMGRLEGRAQEITQREERIAQMNQRIDSLNDALKAEGERRAAAEAKLKTIQEDEARLPNTFKALSADALRASTEEFIKLAKSSLETFHTEAKGDLTQRQKAIDALVQPLKDNLERYQKLIADMSRERSGQYTSIQDQVKALIESEKQLRDETGKLATALSAPQVRGHWGEITLRRVAELAGMVEHCDFVEQESTESERGRLRPDMIVDLPNGRRIVVDAKAPLKAYVEAAAAITEDDRKAKLVAYARQVKARVQDLSRKEYWDQFDEAPEFAVLFLPGEQFLGAALQEEPGLLEDAFRQKVILATPTTLIALLKAVAYGWRQETLAENALQISELGKQLYERLSTLVGHFGDLGKNLDRSIQAYNKAVGSFEGRVLVTARKFKELGATAAEDIPALEPIEHAARQLTPIGFQIEEPEDQPPALS